MSLVSPEIGYLLDGFDAMSEKLNRLGKRVLELEENLLKFGETRLDEVPMRERCRLEKLTALKRAAASSSVNSTHSSQSSSNKSLSSDQLLEFKIRRARSARERIALNTMSRRSPKERNGDTQPIEEILDKPCTRPEASKDGISLPSVRPERALGQSSVGEAPSPNPQERQSNPELLEENFTTKGEPGELGCPFASGNATRQNGPPSARGTLRTKASTRRTLGDPIQAELGDDALSSPSQSAAGSGPKCPIRFLDQHSPEEVAQYFEKHKHEIPRSHEVCVKRYQTNTESIRQLDAKYGNLVSMIQGLGMKHQPLLGENEVEAETSPEEDRRTNERVEKWADRISGSLEDAEDNALSQPNDAERVGHFDRPLKEIRVGESPSRPWGISVPVRDDELLDGLAHGSHRPEASTQPPAPENDEDNSKPEKTAKRCPFGFDKETSGPEPVSVPKPSPPRTPSKSHRPTFIQSKSESGSRSKDTPQMIFTGPVFIGYSMEQAAQLLQRDNAA
ncbi:MAG: hypothetical protein M4579_002972 [Chaenotheca gracillima]|nr:MAG: hypothetical protein M4579_002972 [Chaenotheca gracillima]